MTNRLEELAARATKLQSAMAECQRLDRAAGEERPTLSVGQWVRARMREALLSEEQK